MHNTVMNLRRRASDQVEPGSTANRDTGASLIEILIAVVLLGTVVVAVLGALQVSVIGTRVERDHAKAYQWLQSANGVLQAAERVGCDYDPSDPADPLDDPADLPYADGEEKMRQRYQTLVRSQVVNPPDWDDRQLTVLYPVKIWDGTRYWEPASAPKSCYDVDGFFLQLITLEVTNPNGDIIETIEVVKRD